MRILYCMTRRALAALALALVAGCGTSAPSGPDYDGAKRDLDTAGITLDKPVKEWLDQQANDKRGMCSGDDDELRLVVGMAADQHDKRAADLMRIAIKNACPHRLDTFTAAYEKAAQRSK